MGDSPNLGHARRGFEDPTKLSARPSVEVAVPEGTSSLELALALVQALVSDLGAMVTDVDMMPTGGTIHLRVPA